MWKVGDRVVIVEDNRYEDYSGVGVKGTVYKLRKASDGEYRMSVIFDSDIRGHDLHDECEYGRGWFFHSIEGNKRLIKTNGIIIKKITKKRKNNFY